MEIHTSLKYHSNTTVENEYKVAKLSMLHYLRQRLKGLRSAHKDACRGYKYWKTKEKFRYHNVHITHLPIE